MPEVIERSRHEHADRPIIHPCRTHWPDLFADASAKAMAGLDQTVLPQQRQGPS
jgi:hypothetical protein